jgi:hypothetical protein
MAGPNLEDTISGMHPLRPHNETWAKMPDIPIPNQNAGLPGYGQEENHRGADCHEMERGAFRNDLMQIHLGLDSKNVQQ